jgi:hypothetical protein
VFQENAQQMSSSTFFKLSKEQEDELQRQLWTLKETATYFKTPMVLTMMVVSQQIDNYEYADEPEVVSGDQRLLPHQIEVVEEPSIGVQPSPEVISSVRRGPTPAKTLYDIEVLQKGNTTTVTQRPV